MEELIHNLGIDWKLLLAQVVNFAILFYVLKRFVYTPILKALADRQEGIATTVRQSEEVEQKLREAEALKEEILAKARKDSDSLIKGAEKTALRLKDEKLAESQKEAAKIVAQGKVQIEKDRADLRQELKKEMGTIVAAAVAKTIGDVVDESAQEKLKKEALSIINSGKVHTR